MKLKTLNLQNFQGIKDITIAPDGKDIRISGDNGTGKTTIANAICWLLYAKPSTNEKGYNPKTKDVDGEDIHFLHHIAEGIFELDDGSLLTLKKDFYEDWKKVRGSNTENFKGNTLDYYIDGVPVKEKEYTARLEEICPAEKAKMLTIPDYFSETLPWQKRREILLEVCGDITDQDVIHANEELHDLNKYLLKLGSTDQYYTVEEYAAIAKSKKAEINKELQMIPARIDEARKAIIEEKLDIDTLDSMISTIDMDIDATEEKIRALSNDDEKMALRAEIYNINTAMAEAKSLLAKENEQANHETEEKININL